MAQIFDVGVTLSTDHLRVNAGEEAKLTVTVHNNGPEMDCFRLEVNGLDPAWWEFDVPSKPLLPHEDPCRDCTFQSVLVINPPPNATALANYYPLEIRATPEHNYRQGTAVPVSFEILPFYSFECKLEPDEVTGGRGDFVLELCDTGNKELNIDVAGQGHQDLSQISFLKDGSWERRVNVRVDPGEGKKLHLPVSVQPFGRPFIGKPRVCDFTIVATPQERGLARTEIRGRFNSISRMALWVSQVAAFLRRPFGTPSLPPLRVPAWVWIICGAVLMAVVVTAIILILVGRPTTYLLEFQLNSGEEKSFALPLPEASIVRIAGNAQWQGSGEDLAMNLVRPDGSRSALIVLSPSTPGLTFTIDEQVGGHGPEGWLLTLHNQSGSENAQGTLRISTSAVR